MVDRSVDSVASRSEELFQDYGPRLHNTSLANSAAAGGRIRRLACGVSALLRRGQVGADLPAPWRLSKYSAKKDAWQKMGTLRGVLTPGHLPMQRLRAAWPTAPSTCLRCGVVSESLLHRYWQSLSNDDIEHPVMSRTADMAERVASQVENTCFGFAG